MYTYMYTYMSNKSAAQFTSCTVQEPQPDTNLITEIKCNAKGYFSLGGVPRCDRVLQSDSNKDSSVVRESKLACCSLQQSIASNPYIFPAK